MTLDIPTASGGMYACTVIVVCRRCKSCCGVEESKWNLEDEAEWRGMTLRGQVYIDITATYIISNYPRTVRPNT